jgi:ABC-type branched-subunit amino acid transport system substrate-binding protein
MPLTALIELYSLGRPILNKTFLMLTVSLFLCACSADSLRVGFIGNLSGEDSDIAVKSRRVIECLFLHSGLPITVVSAHDSNTSSGARAAVRRLAESGCQIMIGPFLSATTEGAAAECRQRGLVLISPTAAGVFRNGPSDCFCPLNLEASSLGRELGHWCRDSGHLRLTTVIDSVNITYARLILAGFYSVLGVHESTHHTFYSGNIQRDYGALVADILKPDPQALLFIGTGYDAAMISQWLDKIGYPLPIYTTAWALNTDLVSQGGLAAERVRGVSVWDPEFSCPCWQGFVERYTQLFGSSPGYAESQVIDAGLLVLALVKKGGRLTPDVLAQVLQEFKGINGELRIDASGNFVRPIRRVSIRTGRFVRVGG